MPGGSYAISHDFFPVMKSKNLIAEVADPTDRRRKLYRSLQGLSESQEATSEEHISPPPYTGPMTKYPGRDDGYGVAFSESENDDNDEPDF